MAGIGTNAISPGILPPENLIAPQPVQIRDFKANLPVNDRPAWSKGPPGAYKDGLAGFGQRIGDALHAPGVSAALFRSGAATLNGGLGAGLQAAANYMDGQKAQAAHDQQQQFMNGLEMLRQQVAQQQADQTGLHYERGDTTEALRVGEAARHNRVSEGIDANGQRIQLYGINTNAATAQRGQDVSVLNNSNDNATSTANNIRSTDASRYGTDGQAYVAGLKPAGIGSGYTETVTTVPASPPSSSWFGGGSAGSPKTVSTTRTPLATGRPTPPPALAGATARVSSDADYAKLPSGAMFVAPDGSTRRKP